MENEASRPTIRVPMRVLVRALGLGFDCFVLKDKGLEFRIRGTGRIRFTPKLRQDRLTASTVQITTHEPYTLKP